MMQPLDLMPSTRHRLTAFRRGDLALAVFDLDAAVVEEALKAVCQPFVERNMAARQRVLQYNWYVKELAGVLRLRQGWDLAFELELLLRRWVGFRLDPRVLQLLLRASCRATALAREAKDAHAQEAVPE